MVESPSSARSHRSSRSRSSSSSVGGGGSSATSPIPNEVLMSSQSQERMSFSSQEKGRDLRADGESSPSIGKVSGDKLVKIIQVSNVAPRATRQQLVLLFGHLGKIEEVCLYESTTAPELQMPKICFIRYHSSKSVSMALHLTNTVFIDRVLIVMPYMDGDDLPDEAKGLELLASTSLLSGADPKLPQHVTSQLDGFPPHMLVVTTDPHLLQLGLPPYPSLPPSVDARQVAEIRRTVLVCNVDDDMTAESIMEYFTNVAGEIKYFRFCSRDNDPLRFALIEFTEQPSILKALQANGQTLGKNLIKVYHAALTIDKPQAKSNEVAQKEIEEAMSRQSQSLLTQEVEALTPSIRETGRKRSRSKSYSSRQSRSSGRRRRSTSEDRSASRSPKRYSRSRYRSRTPPVVRIRRSPRRRSSPLRRSRRERNSSPRTQRDRSRSPRAKRERSRSPRTNRKRSRSPRSKRERSRSPRSKRERSRSPRTKRSRSRSNSRRSRSDSEKREIKKKSKKTKSKKSRDASRDRDSDCVDSKHEKDDRKSKGKAKSKEKSKSPCKAIKDDSKARKTSSLTAKASSLSREERKRLKAIRKKSKGNPSDSEDPPSQSVREEDGLSQDVSCNLERNNN